MQGDVEKELDALISDMLEERFGMSEPSEENLKSVLTELGTPEELALKYLGDEKKSFISGIYFMYYKRILRLVLPIAAAIALVGRLFYTIFNFGTYQTPPDIIRLLVELIVSPIGIMVQGFAIITIIFAIMEWKKTELKDVKDFFEELPELPEVIGEESKPWYSIVGMAWVAGVATVFLVFPQIVGMWTNATGWISLFDIGMIQSLWIPIIIWAVVHIGWYIVRLIEGQYTIKFAIATAVVNVIISICAVVILWNNSIINPEFIEYFMSLFSYDGFPLVMFENLNFLVLGIILVVAIAETAVVSYRALKVRNR